MQHDVVPCIIRVVFRAPSAPVIRDRVSQNRAISIEATAGDRLGTRLHGLKPLLGVLVPEIIGTIRAHRGKGSVLQIDLKKKKKGQKKVKKEKLASR